MTDTETVSPLQQLRDGMALIREAVEEHMPVGILPAREATGVEPLEEVAALVKEEGDRTELQAVGRVGRSMTDLRCPICFGTGWVCENHPDKPWTKKGCECGAGMPCPKCNWSDPPDFSAIMPALFDKDGWRH